MPNGTEGFHWLPGEQLSALMNICSKTLTGRHVPRYMHVTGKQVLLRGKVKPQSQEQQRRQRRACPSSTCASVSAADVAVSPHSPPAPPHPPGALRGPGTDRHGAKGLRNKRRSRGNNSFSHSFHLIFSRRRDQEVCDVPQHVFQRLRFPFGAAGVETKALKGLKLLVPEQGGRARTDPVFAGSLPDAPSARPHCHRHGTETRGHIVVPRGDTQPMPAVATVTLAVLFQGSGLNQNSANHCTDPIKVTRDKIHAHNHSCARVCSGMPQSKLLQW